MVISRTAAHVKVMRLSYSQEARCLVAEPSHGVQHFQASQPALRIVVRRDAFGQMLGRHRRLAEDDAQRVNFWIVTQFHLLAHRCFPRSRPCQQGEYDSHVSVSIGRRCVMHPEVILLSRRRRKAILTGLTGAAAS